MSFAGYQYNFMKRKLTMEEFEDNLPPLDIEKYLILKDSFKTFFEKNEKNEKKEEEIKLTREKQIDVESEL